MARQAHVPAATESISPGDEVDFFDEFFYRAVGTCSWPNLSSEKRSFKLENHSRSLRCRKWSNEVVRSVQNDAIFVDYWPWKSDQFLDPDMTFGDF